MRIEHARIQKEFDDLRVNHIDINKLTPRERRDFTELELKEITAFVNMHHLQPDDTTPQTLVRSNATTIGICFVQL